MRDRAERREAMVARVVVPNLVRQAGAGVEHDGSFRGSYGQLGGTPLGRVFAQTELLGEPVATVTVGTMHEQGQQISFIRAIARQYGRAEVVPNRTLVTARPAPAVARAPEVRETVFEGTAQRSGVKGRLGMDAQQVDIERLTDRVVRQLDNRLIAYRERMGKLA